MNEYFIIIMFVFIIISSIVKIFKMRKKHVIAKARKEISDYWAYLVMMIFLDIIIILEIVEYFNYPYMHDDIKELLSPILLGIALIEYLVNLVTREICNDAIYTYKGKIEFTMIENFMWGENLFIGKKEYIDLYVKLKSDIEHSKYYNEEEIVLTIKEKDKDKVESLLNYIK